MVKGFFRVKGIRALFIITICSNFFISCETYLDAPVYQRPLELEGKLFTQLKDIDSVSVFLECLELTGLNEQIEKTGYYTVFAPTDEAFQLFFNDYPEYSNDVENIPEDVLERIIRFHILQNGWTKNQLKTLDYKGWINPKDDFYNVPRGFKRQTLLKDPNRKVAVSSEKGVYQLDFIGESDEFRSVLTDSRKYIPLYYNELFSYYNYNSDDYSFYFERPFEGEDPIYYANGKIISDAIPAENGFIYLIDQVVPPMENLETILNVEGGRDYSIFLGMIYEQSELIPDIDATISQSFSSEQQFTLDTLFRVSYPNLAVNITNEIVGRSVNYNVREHSTLIAPTNDALLRLINEIVTVNSGYPHWTIIDIVPDFIKAMIINAHMSTRAEYETDFNTGFVNSLFDSISIQKESIIEKKYGSNGAFIGVNEPIIPRAFKSVAAPVYLRPGFSLFMYAMQKTNIMPAIKSIDKEFELFIIPDHVFSADSSLIMEWDDINRTRYSFYRYSRSEQRMYRIPHNDLVKLILNQVVIGRPQKISNVEFLPNLAGNYIVYDHNSSEVRGARPTVYGFQGDSVLFLQPDQVDYPTDNGSTYITEGWFSVPNSETYSLLSKYKGFMDLLDKAGLALKKEFKMKLTQYDEKYTIFVPSDSALNAIRADTINVERLREILKTHFIEGHILFTDMSSHSGYYTTMREEFFNLDIRKQPDKIIIYDDEQNIFVEINEDPVKTNIIIGYDTNRSWLNTSDYDYVTTGVIHEIDKVLNFK